MADIKKQLKEAKAQTTGSEAELFESSSKGNKKRKKTLLENDTPSDRLNFQPSSAQNLHLPMSLATRAVKDERISLPIVLRFNDGTTAVLTTNVNEAKVGKKFQETAIYSKITALKNSYKLSNFYCKKTVILLWV